MLSSLKNLLKSTKQRIRYRFGYSSHGLRLSRLPYVFFIGFNRTATRAFHELFLAHGIPSVHWDSNRLVGRMLTNIVSGRKILSGYDSKFLIFSDLILSNNRVWIEGNQFFRELCLDYPSSIFVLNHRKTEDWLLSRINQNQGRNLRRQLKILQCSDVESATALWRSIKNQHEEHVQRFFKDKADRFVEIDINSPDVVELLSSKLPYDLDPGKWKTVGEGS